MQKQTSDAWRVVNGYPEILLDGHWKMLHRRTVETYSGRRLPAGHAVHHIDGNKWNNELHNVAVLPSSAHLEWHRLCWSIDPSERANLPTRQAWQILHQAQGVGDFIIAMARSAPPALMHSLGVLEFELPCPDHILRLDPQVQRCLRHAAIARRAILAYADKREARAVRESVSGS